MPAFEFYADANVEDHQIPDENRANQVKLLRHFENLYQRNQNSCFGAWKNFVAQVQNDKVMKHTCPDHHIKNCNLFCK